MPLYRTQPVTYLYVVRLKVMHDLWHIWLCALEATAAAAAAAASEVAPATVPASDSNCSVLVSLVGWLVCVYLSFFFLSVRF